ncbi:hypothetical protein GCM10010390_32040 [Streptomyces mordarskii]|uniref:Uncharacterized protein n=1 Tax=Streptomyces mordarskii TaxID=1226758 RepID=A0ABN1CVP1_9ACTN
MAVLRDEERFETALLQGAPQRGGPDALVGDERGYADFHCGSLGRGASMVYGNHMGTRPGGNRNGAHE